MEYERLSAEDNAFLLAERPNAPMHVSAVEIFEAGPLRRPGGGVDADAIRRAYAAALPRIPRYRQKLAWVPLARRAVWVDDPDFQIDYHVRHVSLPRPGDLADLKRMSARVMSHALDLSRPLWEIWIVEGLEGDRFAIVSKVHHCMIDGASGVEMAQILLSPDPDARAGAPERYTPRPAPSLARLVADEAGRWVTLPWRTADGLRAALGGAGDLGRAWSEIGQRLEALRDLAGLALHRVSPTPLNGPLGPHRRFDWLTTPLPETKEIRRAFGCTVNDVVLATVTGAVRAYLARHGGRPEEIEFRVSAPVSVRRDDERSQMGNRVSSWLVSLPLGESDARARVDAIHAQTLHLKETRQAQGIDMLMAAAEYAPAGIVSLGSRLASGPINSIVTNVPGPQFPLYMLGAKLVAMFPQVPLLDGLGLGIALMSYDGWMHWGFTADYDRVADLDAFVADVRDAFAELADAAGVRLDPERLGTLAAEPAAPSPASAAG